jgi:hypothetical protein
MYFFRTSLAAAIKTTGLPEFTLAKINQSGGLRRAKEALLPSA